MQITRLRLLGFKSFVEPTDLTIDKGLTGVVGPNGCGKSNLLEALRWVMGETSHKSMRAASMDDVIFSGTTTRPGRNIAEVTIFIDNAARTAPAEFNNHDVLEVTRRIEREMGSAYRVNAKETRARDIKILFEDAATGARSPALVRQGQISEIVNAKPEQRRRILEDAAGIAGLHSRRHDAELRLRAAETNLARVSDVLSQLNTQVEALKRQARQARRYKELSVDIRKAEILQHHLAWIECQTQVETEEAAMRSTLEMVAGAAQAESELTRAELAAAEVLPALRETEAAAAAALRRSELEHDHLQREIERAGERQRDLQLRAEQMRHDEAREKSLAAEAVDAHTGLTKEKTELNRAASAAGGRGVTARARVEATEAAVKTIDTRLAGLQTAAAEVRARRKSLEGQHVERREALARLERQLAALDAQANQLEATAPSASEMTACHELVDQLTDDGFANEEALLAAEDALARHADALAAAGAAAQSARVAAERLAVEVETLTQLVEPARDSDSPSVVDRLTVEQGFEQALAAALGEDLDASLDPALPIHWRLNDAAAPDPDLPAGAASLSDHVDAPPELTRRLRQIGLVDTEDGARLQPALKPGQRLVTRDGDLWRWDGFVAAASGKTAAARRLAHRNRLGGLGAEHLRLASVAKSKSDDEARASEAHRTADEVVKRHRQLARDIHFKLADARQSLAGLDQRVRDADQRRATIDATRGVARDALGEAGDRLAETALALESLSEADAFEEQLAICLDDAAEKRSAVADARASLASLEREESARRHRLLEIDTDIARASERKATAQERAQALAERFVAITDELAHLLELPDTLSERRDSVLSAIADARHGRDAAADALAEADRRFREIQSELRAAQSAHATTREARARAEARLEAARNRRAETSRKIRETLAIHPEECLKEAGYHDAGTLPDAPELERLVARLKADRDRLGGVNLAADDDLARMTTEFDAMDKERLDVELAIAKLRAGIAELNKEAKGRLDAAFETVNGHFQRLFGILFNGGEARLAMIQSPDDPLEGGLEIFARPPGKKPATLSLLSGGEQTLTALSLIFAVFLTNPSPICVLDEVDAPLDDANVDRFCTMMERMSEETSTRFLVITHHPMTMARMDRLFGVTMAEKGVSQLVSVDLQVAKTFVEAAE